MRNKVALTLIMASLLAAIFFNQATSGEAAKDETVRVNELFLKRGEKATAEIKRLLDKAGGKKEKLSTLDGYKFEL